MPTKTQTPSTAEPVVTEADSEVQAILKKCVVKHTPTSLEYSPGTSYEEWSVIFGFYSGIGNSSLWWVGDSIRFAESSPFACKYTQAIDLHGKEYSTLTSVVSVCERFSDPKRRRESKRCSFWMHAEVAYIPPQEADHILDQVERGILNREEVRDIVARKKGLPTKAEREAIKTAKKTGTVKLLPPAATPSLPIIDIAPRPIVWNGYPVTLENGKLFTGPEPLPDREAAMAAKDNGFPSVEAMTKALENQAPPVAPAPIPETAKPAEASTPPSVLPMPPATAQAATLTPQEDQNIAAQRVIASINQLAEAFTQLDFDKVMPLGAKRLLKFLEPIDIAIDKLSKKIGAPVITR